MFVMFFCHLSCRSNLHKHVSIFSTSRLEPSPLPLSLTNVNLLNHVEATSIKIPFCFSFLFCLSLVVILPQQPSQQQQCAKFGGRGGIDNWISAWLKDDGQCFVLRTAFQKKSALKLQRFGFKVTIKNAVQSHSMFALDSIEKNCAWTLKVWIKSHL